LNNVGNYRAVKTVPLPFKEFEGGMLWFPTNWSHVRIPTISSIEPYQSRTMAFKVHPSKWGFLFLKILGLPKCFTYKLVLKGTCTKIPNSWHSTQFLYFLGGGASSRNLLLKVYHSWSKYWIDFCGVPTTTLCSRWSHDFCERRKSQSYESDSTSPSN
jgi:hypothetical protein